MIVQCYECKQKFEIPNEEYKEGQRAFCSIECAVYAGYFTIAKGWRQPPENEDRVFME